MTKSQVSSLLHVLEGYHKDATLAYPALEESLSKDLGRLRLYCQSRGLGLFTLDLPHLNSLLLRGFESGRLTLEGPLSTAVSKRVRVPRLYSGLWLRVFDNDACLKHEVDVTALAFLITILDIGKKLEVECSYDRTQAVVRAYHDIESRLRRPTHSWSSDSLGIEITENCDSGRDSDGGANLFSESNTGQYDGNCHSGSSHLGCVDNIPCSSFIEEPGVILDLTTPSIRKWNGRHMSVHLVQAFDGSNIETTPLFRNEKLDSSTKLEDQFLLNQVQKVADLISGTFDTYDPLSYSVELEVNGEGIGFKHGPGAVADRLKNWEKSEFPNWPSKLQYLFPFELCAKNVGDDREEPLNHELASRLISVPKTTKGPRLIAAESTSHQWCQQLTWRFLQDQCRTHFGGYFIDFKDQRKSGDLVLEASKNRELATVDLSDASDRLSCWTVERMFRGNPSILTALHATRTRYLRDEISEDKGFLSLRKFASQGTATTFPVMSIVMLIIALGVTLDDEVSWSAIKKLRNQVRVFGDDIIIPSRGYGRLVRVMDLLQLKVNVAKSYVNGHFRESCGVYGYGGFDVTPVRPKHIVADSPASCQAVVDISNNLYLKGYWHAASACYDLLPARLRRGIRIVGVHEVGFRGLASYSGSDERHLDKRWNSRLHRFEVRGWSIVDRPQKRPRNGYPALLDFFASKHTPSQARTVSEYAGSRKSKIGLLWEPSIDCGNSFESSSIHGQSGRKTKSNLVLFSEKWVLSD
jgi:hypothetical protein